MIVFFICPAGQILDPFQGRIIDHLAVCFELVRTGESGGNTAFFCDLCRMDFFSQIIGQFCLVYLIISSQEYDHIFIIGVFLIHNSFAGVFYRYAQEIDYFFNGFTVRCIDFLQLAHFQSAFIFHLVSRCFHIRTVAALRTDYDGIFPCVGQKHIFMGNTASHHAGIRLYCNDLRHSRTLEDPVIGVIENLIVTVQILLRSVEGISVFHSKFSYTDQAGSWTGFIPEFGLDLIDHKRIFGISLSIFSYQLDRSFLMGHSQDHLAAAAVFKAEQFLADTFKTAGFFP